MRPRGASRPTLSSQAAGISGAALGDAEDRSGFPPSSPRSGRPDLRPVAPFPTPGAGEDTADAQPGRVEDSAGRRRNRPADPPSGGAEVSDLAVRSGSDEWDVAPLLKNLLEGFPVSDLGYFRLEKNNVPLSLADLDAKYKTDYRFSLDGQTIGYLDVERKVKWTTGDWPYPWVNLAKHPMSHWGRNDFTGRPTNKIISFRERPATSIWLAVRADGQAVLPVPAATLLDHGEDHEQPNGYGPPLPVLRIRRTLAPPVFDDADCLADFIALEVLRNVR